MDDACRDNRTRSNAALIGVQGRSYTTLHCRLSLATTHCRKAVGVSGARLPNSLSAVNPERHSTQNSNRRSSCVFLVRPIHEQQDFVRKTRLDHLIHCVILAAAHTNSTCVPLARASVWLWGSPHESCCRGISVSKPSFDRAKMCKPGSVERADQTLTSVLTQGPCPPNKRPGHVERAFPSAERTSTNSVNSAEGGFQGQRPGRTQGTTRHRRDIEGQTQ